MTVDPARQASAHLYWSELACHDRMQTPYPEDLRKTVLPKLTAAFEGWRTRVGDKPGLIVSAYRTPAWNDHVGGEAHSFHIQGAALDVVFEGVTVLDAATAAVREAQAHRVIRGIGYYPEHGFVHIDVGKRDRLTLWKCVTSLSYGKPVRNYIPWDGESV